MIPFYDILEKEKLFGQKTDQGFARTLGRN
jgi:hypothetical protein